MRLLLIGSGGMAKACADLLVARRPGALVGILTRRQFACSDGNVALVTYERLDSPQVRRIVRQLAPDAAISANCLDILPAWLLAGLRFAVNFHAGPLPRYAGLNTPSWAILNGERRYGIAWHLINDVIDGGDIVARRDFAVAPDITSRDLVLLCQSQGIDAFADLIDPLLQGDLRGEPQNMTERRYFSRKMLPFGGWLPITDPGHAVERLARALSFFPFANTFFEPRATAGGRAFSIVRFETAASPHHCTAGTVLAVTRSSVNIATMAGCVSLIELRDDQGTILAPEAFVHAYGIEVGQAIQGKQDGE